VKRSQLDDVLRRKVRLRISSKKRGRFGLNLTADGSLQKFEPFPNKRQAMTALLVRLRTMPALVIEVKAL